MSTKRILGVAILGILLIVAAISVVLVTSFMRLESDAVRLPEESASPKNPYVTEPDALDRVEVNRDTIQAAVSTLSRPDIYSREVIIESFWDGGSAVYNINVSVYGSSTSLRTNPAIGVEKRIIVTSDALYIWYKGDRAPFIGVAGSGGEEHKSADEWQMLVTYEDVLRLDRNDIIDAGYTEFGGEECLYVEYISRHFNHTILYYISLELGLVVAVEEHDGNGVPVYRMSAGKSLIGEIDPAAFVLPDGTNLIEG